MSDANYDNWGAWIRRRAAHIGFRSQADLAERVGCRPEQVSRWCAMKHPPVVMRKSFDSRLAAALRTSHDTLFANWADTSPETAAIDASDPIGTGDDTALRRKMLAIVELLDTPQLGELHDKGRELLAAGMRHQAVA